MAYTLSVRLEATILDEMNVKAIATAYALIDPTASFATIQAILNEWLSTLDAVTAGQIIDAGIDVVPSLPGGLKTLPAAGSRVEQTGVFNYTAAGDTHLWGFAVPAIADSQVVAGKIDLTTGHPAQVLAAYLAAGGTAALEWTNAVSQVLSTFADCFLSIRKHSRQLSRNTFET